MSVPGNKMLFFKGRVGCPAAPCSPSGWLAFIPNEEAHECPDGSSCSALADVHNISFEKLRSGCLMEELF